MWTLPDREKGRQLTDTGSDNVRSMSQLLIPNRSLEKVLFFISNDAIRKK